MGDAIYVNSIAQAFAKQYDKVKVRTKFPEVFQYCDGVECVQFKKGGADREFNYGGKRRADQSTTQWEDLLITSGLPKDTPYQTAWKLDNRGIANEFREKFEGQKTLILSIPHIPFARLDRFGLELMPEWKKIIPLLSMARDAGYKVVQTGKGKKMFDFSRYIDLDLSNKTTVADTMDLGLLGDVFIGQPGFIVPLAEGFNKYLFIMFSQRGLNSNTEFLSNITGKKVCSTPKGFWGVDSFADERNKELFKKCLLI